MEEAIASKSDYSNPINILLVEDNPGDIRMIEIMLCEALDIEYQLHVVDTFDNAVAELQRSQYQIILLDLTLPDVSGLETVCKTYEIAPRIPIIVLTGLDDENTPLRAIREGVQDYICKNDINSQRIAKAIFYALERKQLEEKIRNSYHHQMTLMRELQHRVKNNLQLIISLLDLQRDFAGNSEVIDVLRDSQNRIKTVATLEDILYRFADIGKIKADDYVERLLAFIYQSYGISSRTVSYSIDAGDLCLHIDHTVPCGLVINELTSMSLRYNYSNNEIGKISIGYSRIGVNKLKLDFCDTGTMIPTITDLNTSESLGLQLVDTLVCGELNGTINIDQERGLNVSIVFPEKNEKPALRMVEIGGDV